MFVYSAILVTLLIGFIIGYFIFMLPSLYVDHMKKSYFDEIVQVQKHFIKDRDYSEVSVRNPTATFSFRIPENEDSIYVYNTYLSVKVSITNEKLLSLLYDVRDKFQQASEGDDAGNFKEASFSSDFKEVEQLMKEVFVDSPELPIQFEEVQVFDRENFKEVFSRFRAVGKNIAVYQWDGTDGMNYYTNYIACSKDNDDILLTLLPVMTPRMSEIRPVVLQSLPMIVAVTVLLILFSTHIIAQKIITPIQKLASHAEYVRNTGNLIPEKEIAEGEDEIAILSQSLNVMYAQLSAQYVELKQSNQRLQEQNEKQEVFLRASSHQLKTPIAAAMLLVDGMIQQIGKFRDVEMYLPKVKEQLRTMQKMVEDILDLSRCERERKTETVNVKKIIIQKMASYHVQMEERGLTWDASLQEVLLETDGEILYTILDNVISNGVRYAKEGTKLQISLEKTAFTLLTRNEGIQEEILPHIFEPFVTGEENTSMVNKGHGLGLYVVSYYSKVLGFSATVRNVKEGVETAILFKK